MSESFSLNVDDQFLRDLLQNAGVTVRNVNDGTLPVSAGDAIVVASSSCSSIPIGALRLATVPVIVGRAAAWDDMDLTSSNSSTSDQSVITISNAGHPLAAGFSNGDIPFYWPAQQ